MTDETGIFRRLERLETIETIRALKTHYWVRLDAVDLDAVRNCFTDDAVIEMEGVPAVDGPDGYLRYLRGIHQHPGRSMGLHTGQNPRIELLSAAHARGVWDQIFVGMAFAVAENPASLLRLTGIYDDEYRQVGGHWRISAMRFRQTSFAMLPVPENGVAARSSADFFKS